MDIHNAPSDALTMTGGRYKGFRIRTQEFCGGFACVWEAQTVLPNIPWVMTARLCFDTYEEAARQAYAWAKLPAFLGTAA